MYHIYRELIDDNTNEVIHKCPVAKCKTLNIATKFAIAQHSILPLGIYEITSNGEKLIARV